MKKINSIDYGGKVIAVGIIIMLIIPGILAMLNTFIESDYIPIISWILFVLGAGILFCFGVVLCIELKQDKILDKYYSSHKYIKLKLNDNKYECGACGNRNVYAGSTICDVCGCKFENVKDFST